MPTHDKTNEALALCRLWIEQDEGRSLESVVHIDNKSRNQLGKPAFNEQFVAMCKAIIEAQFVPSAVAPQERIGKDHEARACDWVEDFPYENGKYWNVCTTCERQFLGHKRRVTCKLCAAIALRIPEPMPKPGKHMAAVDYGRAEGWNECRKAVLELNATPSASAPSERARSLADQLSFYFRQPATARATIPATLASLIVQQLRGEADRGTA